MHLLKLVADSYLKKVFRGKQKDILPTTSTYHKEDSNIQFNSDTKLQIEDSKMSEQRNGKLAFEVVESSTVMKSISLFAEFKCR